MTERSMFWSDGVGDGGPYSQDELRLLYDALAGSEDANRGVLVEQSNQLNPSSTGNNNVRMATGRAVVDGTLYENDAILDIVTASPAIDTTGRRLVLQKDWTTRTVRAVVITSADGVGAIPALTQNDGTTWEIPICSFTITTGGVIGALTDQREFCEGTSGASTVLDRDLAQQEVVSSIVRTTIYSHVIPAGALGITGGFRLLLAGDLLDNAAGNLTLRVRLGTTDVLVTSALTINNDANRYKWWLEIVCMNSAAAAQKWSALFKAVASAATFAWQLPASAIEISGVGYDTSAEDTAGALTLDVSVEWSLSSANHSFRKEIALLERIPPE